MKHLTLVLVVAALALFLGVSAHATTADSSPIDSQQLDLMADIGLDVPAWMGLATVDAGFGLNCPAPTNYCSYRFNKFDYCCDVVWAAPGAFCPRICA